MRIAAALLLALSLSGCFEKSGPKLDVPIQPRQALSEQVPSDLFVCEERPDGSWVKTYRDVTIFITELDEAYEDCKTKLETAGRIVKGTR